MKKHVIIPIFIPHQGCRHSCVFCNQKTITARSAPPDGPEVVRRIENYLSTLQGRNLTTIEVAFFGGSFTGIPTEMQNAYLEIAERYKDAGQIHKIRLSTRPDCISRTILENLKRHQVDIIELGVQSFDPDVLVLSDRGHTTEDSYRACRLIREYGFQLGIQLMIGLPGDTGEKSVISAHTAASLVPEFVRLYPTVILHGTKLAEMYEEGDYVPFSGEEMVQTVKEMYRILFNAGITILRVGLKSTDLITQTSDLGGGYHPAFRQVVEGELAREEMETRLKGLAAEIGHVTFSSSEKWFSAMIGHRGCNRKYFAQAYPALEIKYAADPALKDGVVACRTEPVLK